MTKRTDEGFDTLRGGIQPTVTEDEAEFLTDCGGIAFIIPEFEEGEEEECTEQF